MTYIVIGFIVLSIPLVYVMISLLRKRRIGFIIKIAEENMSRLRFLKYKSPYYNIGLLFIETYIDKMKKRENPWKQYSLSDDQIETLLLMSKFSPDKEVRENRRLYDGKLKDLL